MRATARDGEEEQLSAADRDGLEIFADADVNGEEGLDSQVTDIRTGAGEDGTREEEGEDGGQEGWEAHFGIRCGERIRRGVDTWCRCGILF